MSSSPSPAPDLAIATPPLASRAIGGFGTSILGGVALGGAAWFADGLACPLSLLIPANAIGAWLGVAFVLGASARTIPIGGPPRRHRAAVGGRRVLRVHRTLGYGFGIGASMRRRLGRGRLCRPGLRRAGRDLAWVGLAAGGRCRALWPLRSSPRGWCSAARVWSACDQVQYDPGALLLAGEIVLGLALPWLLFRRGERRAATSRWRSCRSARPWPSDPVTGGHPEVADRF